MKHLTAHKIKHDRERVEGAEAMEIRLRVEAVNRWYVHDWNTLDNKIRSSIVEGVSVFLSMFDLPSRRARVLPARARRGGSPRAPPATTRPTRSTARTPSSRRRRGPATCRPSMN